jgi:hypothetical protein
MDFRGCLPEALPREYEGPRHIVKVGQRHILLAVTLTGLTFAQQPKTPATVAKITSTAVDGSSAAEEVLAFKRNLDAAFVRGDVAYIDRVSRPDLTVTHGDGWINGGKPQSVDDKRSFLKRVESRLTACVISTRSRSKCMETSRSHTAA